MSHQRHQWAVVPSARQLLLLFRLEPPYRHSMRLYPRSFICWMCLSQLCFSSSLYQAVFLSTAGLLVLGALQTHYSQLQSIYFFALWSESKKRRSISALRTLTPSSDHLAAVHLTPKHEKETSAQLHVNKPVLVFFLSFVFKFTHFLLSRSQSDECLRIKNHRHKVVNYDSIDGIITPHMWLVSRKNLFSRRSHLLYYYTTERERTPASW